MAQGDIHVGDMPTFEYTFRNQDDAVVDISGATVLEVTFRKPNAATVKKYLTIVDGAAGTAKYDVDANTLLDLPGVWTDQGFVQLANGKEYHSDKRTFRVHANL